MLIALLTASFVISLNVILLTFTFSNFFFSFNTSSTCHEIASPSLSGSVAKNKLSPVLTTHYLRSYFISSNDLVRATIDINLMG